jgi:LAO/AO transport system kinase
MKAHHGVNLTRAARKPAKPAGGVTAHEAASTSAPDAAALPTWDPPVLLTVAPQGEGVEPLVAALDRHQDWMAVHGELLARRTRRLAARTREVVDRAMQRWIWGETRAEDLLRERIDEVALGRLSPYDLAAEIVAGLKEGARV